MAVMAATPITRTIEAKTDNAEGAAGIATVTGRVQKVGEVDVCEKCRLASPLVVDFRVSVRSVGLRWS